MNPLKLLKLIGLYRKGEAIAKENVPMNTKILLYSHLGVTVGGIVAAAATGWLNAHQTAFAIAVGLSAVLHAMSPSVFGGPSAQASQSAGLGNKVGLLLLAAVLLMSAYSAHAQTAPAPTPAPVATAPAPAPSTGNGFAGSSYALAVDYKGTWSAGTLVQESFDFLDFGAAKANHLYVVGNEFVAPTPGFSLYTGGLRLEPNLGNILAKTNVPAGSFGLFAEASIGSGIPATGPSQVAWLAGGGAKVQLTSALSWQSFQVQFGGTGAQRVTALSTGLSFIFTK